MKRSRLATYAMGVAVAAALTGCGGDDGDGGSSDSGDFAEQSPTKIVDAATEAMTGLESLRITGDMTSEGQQASIDVQLSNSGDCTGSLEFDQNKIEILGVEGDRWFKAAAAFWTGAGVPDPSAVADKWVIDAEDDFAEFCDVEDFVDGLFEDDSDGKYEVTGTESVDGEDAVVVDQTDSEDGLSTGYILVEEPHYLVKIEKEGDEGGSVDFSAFDEEFEVTAPSEDEIVDLSQLG